jgi:ABC-type nitrate/sulfonate/bicarbonate transport system permease component
MTRLRYRQASLASLWLISERKLTYVSIVGTFVAWVLLSLAAGTDSVGKNKVPGPLEVIASFSDFANYWPGGFGVESTQFGGDVTWTGIILGFGYNVGFTCYRVGVGLILGVSAGLGLAVTTAWWSVARAMLAFPAHFIRLLPLLAMAPLFALWFGGESSLGGIFFVAFTAFAFVFPVAVGAIAAVPRHYANSARSLGASQLVIYTRVTVPAAIPGIRGGINLAVGFSWSAGIVAEYITYPSGLGHIVKNAAFFGNTDLLGMMAFLTLLLAAGSLLIVRRTLDHWTRWAE